MLGCLAGIAFGAWAIFSAAKLLLRFAGMALSAVLVPVCARYPLPFCFWVVPGWVGTALASLVVLLLLGPFLAYVPQVLGQAEVPQYEVLKRQIGQTEGVELREYPALNVVEVDAPGGTVKLSMSGAFGRLSSYCVGQNRDPARPDAKGTRIGMSGAVVLRGELRGPDGAVITPPAPGEAAPPGSSLVQTAALTLPRALALEELPAPTDAELRVRAVPAETVVALKLGGPLPDDEVLERAATFLREAAEREGVALLNTPPIVVSLLSALSTEILIPVAEMPPSLLTVPRTQEI